MVAVPGQCRNKAHRGKAILRHRSLELLIFEAVRILRKTVKVDDHRRLPDSLRLHHIKVQWIAEAPLYLQQFHSVARVIVDVADQRPRRSEMAARQCGQGPVLLHPGETRIGWVCDRRGSRLKLSSAGTVQ